MFDYQYVKYFVPANGVGSMYLLIKKYNSVFLRKSKITNNLDFNNKLTIFQPEINMQNTNVSIIGFSNF